MKPVLALLCLLIATNCVRVFLFGGILVYDNSNAYQALAKATGKVVTPNTCDVNWELTKCAKVAVITSACPDSQCGEQEYFQGDQDQAATAAFFESLGMVPRHVKVHLNDYLQTTNVSTLQGKINLQILQQADVIYFNGGDQSRHTRCWLTNDAKPNELFKTIVSRVQKDQVILVGVSAGTAIQPTITAGGGTSFGILYFARIAGLASNTIEQCGNGTGLQDLRNPNSSLQTHENGAHVAGFGFLGDIRVDTHFDMRGRLGRIIPMMVDLKQSLGIGIDEYTSVFYDYGKVNVYGQNGAFIVDLSESSVFPGKYFQIKNVKIHYLTEGDQYNFKLKTFNTTKELITKPFYQGFSDSNNILDSYECTRLLTRLIDQTGLYNAGRVQIPNSPVYPSDTPTYQILFYKSQDTKGYKHNGKYSAYGVRVDFSIKSNVEANMRTE